MKNNKGEMILVILLIAAVGLTIGLSVAGRSVSDTKMSTQIEESNRAFSAAETGIEEVLRQGLINATPPSGTVPTIGASYNVSLDSYGGGEGQYTFSKVTLQNQVETVWLVPHTTTGPDVSTPYYKANWIIICADKENPSSTVPALEVTFLYKTPPPANEYKITRVAYDDVSARRSENHFDNFPPPAGGQNCDRNDGTTDEYDFNGKIQFNLLDPKPDPNSDVLIAMRLRPVYANAKIAVKPQGGGAGRILPEQGKNITSTGQTTSGVTRRWNVTQTFGAPQDIFDYAVWSDKDLTK